MKFCSDDILTYGPWLIYCWLILGMSFGSYIVTRTPLLEGLSKPASLFKRQRDLGRRGGWNREIVKERYNDRSCIHWFTPLKATIAGFG